MYQTYRKKPFKHGGSRAIDLPKEANLGEEVVIEVREDGIFIYSDLQITMESDPNFHLFIEALFQHAMKNPEQLKSFEEVWDNEWTSLLEGVDGGEEL